MPSTTRRPTSVPTLDGLDKIEAALQAGYDELERVTWRVERNAKERLGVDADLEDALPTHEQIGYLFLFAHYMEMRGADIAEHADRIIGALPCLDSVRTDVPLQRAHRKRLYEQARREEWNTGEDHDA